MATPISEMLHALRALDETKKVKQPKAGVDDLNDTFTYRMDNFGWVVVFDYTFVPSSRLYDASVEFSDARIMSEDGRTQQVELSMFDNLSEIESTILDHYSEQDWQARQEGR